MDQWNEDTVQILLQENVYTWTMFNNSTENTGWFFLLGIGTKAAVGMI